MQNFKTVVQSQVELHSCKVEKVDVSIRPLFTNIFNQIYVLVFHKRYYSILGG